jgi:hypothetical protein
MLAQPRSPNDDPALREDTTASGASMVIGERFAWAHLPKTGGMATAELFKLFPELIVYVDPDDTNEKHTTFRERADQVNGKVLAMNLRRLPFWVLSRAQHVARWGIFPDYEPIPMEPPQRLAESSFPDTRIQLYTDEGRFGIDRWLRVESLSEDFLSFISDFGEVSDERRRQVDDLQPVNAHEYDHEIENWFNAEQIEMLYNRNPLWAALERKVYGDLHHPG